MDRKLIEAMLKLIEILKTDGALMDETRRDLRVLEEELELHRLFVTG